MNGVTTLDPGEPASFSVNFDGTDVRFEFGIPRGADGADGTNGEVSTQDLDDAIADTSANSNLVADLPLFVSDPPTQGELQAVVDKLNELIAALRR